MRRFLNSKGAAFIPFLAGVFLIMGWSLKVVKDNWDQAKPPTKKVHLKLVVEERRPLWDRHKVIFEIPVVVPDTEGE